MFEEIYKQVLEGKEAVWKLEDSQSGVSFSRVFEPKARLILLGAGHVSQYVCEFAAKVGFSVIVVDDRKEFATRERFPQAMQVCQGAFDEQIKMLAISSFDYVAVMTRGHLMDDLCMRTILAGTQPRYLGWIGSKRRVQGLFDIYKKEGIDLRRIDAIHSPIGLSIGAVTPEEIAISVVAELIKEKNKTDHRTVETEVLSQKNTDLKLLGYLATALEPHACAIVLETSGSTPVKSGAMMAVDEKGEIYGTVGGGIGEYQVIQEAKKAMVDGKTRVMNFDMTNEVASNSEMVCGGTMKVYIKCVKEYCI